MENEKHSRDSEWKEKIMQIEFYHHFIRFLARLAEDVVSLLKTLKNNLSDLVVTFARSAFQRNLAVIEVFLVSVVVALGGTWQDLDLLGTGLAESGVKYALLPFLFKIKDRLSDKAKKDKKVNAILNQINRMGSSMERMDTAKQYKTFLKIKEEEFENLNRRLRDIGEPTIRFEGQKSKFDEAYAFGNTIRPELTYSPTTREASEKLIPDTNIKTKAEDVLTKFSNTYFKNIDKAYKAGEDLKGEDKLWAPFARGLLQARNDINEAGNKISRGKPFYRSIKYKQKFPKYINEHLLRRTKEQRLAKLDRMLKELEEGPKAFFLKYGVKRKDFNAEDMPDGPIPAPKGKRKNPNTKTKALRNKHTWDRGYGLAVPRREDLELRFDIDKEAQAKRQQEFEEGRKKIEEIRSIDEDAANKALRSLERKFSEDNAWKEIYREAGIEPHKTTKSPAEAFRMMNDKDKSKVITAMVDGEILSHRIPYIVYPKRILSKERGGDLTYRHGLLNGAKIEADKDGSIPIDFEGSVLIDVDATDVTDWSKTKFGDVKGGSVAVLRGMQLSEEGAKSFKRHHNNKIHLLSPEEIEKHKEIFGDYLNRQ